MGNLQAPAERPGRFEAYIGGFEDPPHGTEYPFLLHHSRVEAWRTVFGIIAGFVFYLAVMSVLPTLVIALAWLLDGRTSSYADFNRDALAYLHPAGMLAVNLAIASLIPLSWLLVAGIHRVRPRWLASVGPGIRWRYLAVCTVLAAFILNAMQVASWLLTGTEVRLELQHGFWGFLAVILLTTWAQAVGEEYFFRGYLMQAFGSLARSPWLAILSSAFLFAVMHGTQSLPLFLNRFAFGLVAAVLVWGTGGLEAGIAGHVVNNVFVYIWAGLTTGFAATRGVTEMGWLASAVGVGAYALYALAAWGFARAMRVGMHSAPQDMSARSLDG